MSDPVEAIIAEAPAVAGTIPGAPALAPAPSWTSRVWAKLRAPSPRTDQELAEDLASQLVNGFLDKRTAGTSTEAHLGEAVMDCVYALSDTDGVGATTPLGRLFRAVKSLLGKLRAKMAPKAANG